MSEGWKIDESKTPVKRNSDFFVRYPCLLPSFLPFHFYPVLSSFFLSMRKNVSAVLKEQYFHWIYITDGIRLSNSQLHSPVHPFEVLPPSAQNSAH